MHGAQSIYWITSQLEIIPLHQMQLTVNQPTISGIHVPYTIHYTGHTSCVRYSILTDPESVEFIIGCVTYFRNIKHENRILHVHAHKNCGDRVMGSKHIVHIFQQS